MLADRQTHRQTDRQTDRNTLHPYRGGVITETKLQPDTVLHKIFSYYVKVEVL